MTSLNFTKRYFELWKQNPDKTAVFLLQNQQPDREISYDDLLKGSHGYTQAIEHSGIKPGEVIIIILNYGFDLLFAFWGTIFHGAVPAFMPFLTEKLSPEQYRKSIQSLIEISKPAAIIT